MAGYFALFNRKLMKFNISFSVGSWFVFYNQFVYQFKTKDKKGKN